MYNPAINHQLSTSADAPARLHRLVRRYSVGKSVMRKVDQYLEDRHERQKEREGLASATVEHPVSLRKLMQAIFQGFHWETRADEQLQTIRPASGQLGQSAIPSVRGRGRRHHAKSSLPPLR